MVVHCTILLALAEIEKVVIGQAELFVFVHFFEVFQHVIVNAFVYGRQEVGDRDSPVFDAGHGLSLVENGVQVRLKRRHHDAFGQAPLLHVPILCVLHLILTKFARLVQYLREVKVHQFRIGRRLHLVDVRFHRLDEVVQVLLLDQVPFGSSRVWTVIIRIILLVQVPLHELIVVLVLEELLVEGTDVLVLAIVVVHRVVMDELLDLEVPFLHLARGLLIGVVLLLLLVKDVVFVVFEYLCVRSEELLADLVDLLLREEIEMETKGGASAFVLPSYVDFVFYLVDQSLLEALG